MQPRNSLEHSAFRAKETEQHQLELVCRKCLSDSMNIHHGRHDEHNVFTTAHTTDHIKPKHNWSASTSVNDSAEQLRKLEQNHSQELKQNGKKTKLRELSELALKEISLLASENELLEGILKHATFKTEAPPKESPRRQKSSRTDQRKPLLTAVFPIQGRPMPWEIKPPKEAEETLKKFLVERLGSSRNMQVMTFRSPSTERQSALRREKSARTDRKSGTRKESKGSKPKQRNKVMLTDTEVKRVGRALSSSSNLNEPWKDYGLSSVEDHWEKLDRIIKLRNQFRQGQNSQSTASQTKHSSDHASSPRKNAEQRKQDKKPDTRLNLPKLCKELKLPSNSGIIPGDLCLTSTLRKNRHTTRSLHKTDRLGVPVREGQRDADISFSGASPDKHRQIPLLLCPSPLWPLSLPTASTTNTAALLDGGPDEQELLRLLSERRRVCMLVQRSKSTTQDLCERVRRCQSLVQTIRTE